jgi:hypothetical protein
MKTKKQKQKEALERTKTSTWESSRLKRRWEAGEIDCSEKEAKLSWEESKASRIQQLEAALLR